MKMDRIASLTVVRGEGECRAYFDNVVSEEIKKMNARNRALNEELNTVRARRDRELTMKADRADRLRMYEAPRESRIHDWIERAWAAIFIGGMRLGLWRYEDGSGIDD